MSIRENIFYSCLYIIGFDPKVEARSEEKYFELKLEDEVPIKFIFQDVDGTSYEAEVTANIKKSSKDSKYILRVIRRLPNKKWSSRIFNRIKRK